MATALAEAPPSAGYHIRPSPPADVAAEVPLLLPYKESIVTGAPHKPADASHIEAAISTFGLGRVYAHELGNALTGLKGYLDLMAKASKESPPAKDGLKAREALEDNLGRVSRQLSDSLNHTSSLLDVPKDVKITYLWEAQSLSIKATELGRVNLKAFKEINKIIKDMSSEGLDFKVQSMSAADCLEGVRRNVKRALKLTENYRGVISGDPLKDEKERVDLKTVIADTVEFVGMMKKGWPINLILSEDSPHVMVDPDTFHQVLLNIVKNSIEACEKRLEEKIIEEQKLEKFIDKRKVAEDLKLSVSVKVRSENGKAITEVSDTGLGMSQETREKIFHGHSTKGKGGHGIGLSTCVKFVESNGGTITAASPGVGRGATFMITLPLVA